MRGLRPYTLAPLNRGCAQNVMVQFRENGEWIDKTNKKLYLTAKLKPWDNDGDDSNAVFKAIGTVPDTSEPGRVVFSLTKQQTYKDPTKLYFCDIVETDLDGTSNANRVFIGQFNIIGGANNAQAGGQ